MKTFLLAGTAVLALATSALASPVDWNFGEHPGLLGISQTFDAGGFTLTARGFTLSDSGTALFSKTAGGDESGLGLNNDPSGNDEISGRNFIQLNLDGLLSRLNNFQFSMGSTTQGEGWAVFGSEDGSPFSMTLLASSSGVGDEGLHGLAGGWDNYNFFYTGGVAGGGVGGCGVGCDANVLLSAFDAQAVPGPVVGAGIPGLVTACFGLIGLARNRKRKNAVASS